MHEPLHEISSAFQKIEMVDPWNWTISSLDTLAERLGGARPGGWVRKGSAGMTIASRHRAARASSLDRELAVLAEYTAKIRAPGTPQARLEAVAFFHLRFEMVHPLYDGNGRVGRLIMAAQIDQAYGIARVSFLKALHAHENDYRTVFVSDDRRVRFELMVDLLARLAGLEPPAEGLALPFSIDPLHLGPPSSAHGSRRPQQQQPFWRRF